MPATLTYSAILLVPATARTQLATTRRLGETRAAAVSYRASVPAGHSGLRVSPLYRALSPYRESWSFPIEGTPSVTPTNVHCTLFIVHSYTFSAKEKDVETGLSYFGSRYYSSDLSIWLSVDPLSDKYASLSPYVYCADNPVKLVDPKGEEVDDNLDKWKYNKTTGQLSWYSNTGGKCHQIVVETENTSSGEKISRTVEFDGAIGRLFDFSVISKTVDGIISGALGAASGTTTVLAGGTIAVGGGTVTGGATIPVGSAIFFAGAYQVGQGLIDIANAIAGRSSDMYEQQDFVIDICKSTGNSFADMFSLSKNSTIKDIAKSIGTSILTFGVSTYWAKKVRTAVTHPKMKSIPTDAIIH